jgi:hypothetical protein
MTGPTDDLVSTAAAQALSLLEAIKSCCSEGSVVSCS